MKNLRHLLRRVRPMLSRDAQDSAKGSDGRSRVARNNKRRLLSETLEKRQLFAGDVGDVISDSAPEVEQVELSSGHNYWNKYDVDNNGEITALDALRIINHLNNPAVEGEPVEMGADTTGFIDVNEDFLVTPLDALMVINRLNAEGEAPIPEDQDDFQVQYRIQPRTLDDNLLESTGTYVGQNDDSMDLLGTSDIFTIQQDEVFKIEVGAEDNRPRFSQNGESTRDGLFQSVVNLLIQESGKIEPVIGEVQGADLPTFILDDQNPPNGTVTFFYEGNENNPAEQVSISIVDFVGFSSADTADEVADAIVQLNDLVDSTSDITVTAGVRDEADIYEYRVTYSNPELAGRDIPRLVTVLTIDGAVEPVAIIEDDVRVNGTFNPEALRGNLEVLTRNSESNRPAGADPDFDGPGATPGTPFYGVLRSGRFVSSPGGPDVFEEIGASGGITPANDDRLGIGPLRPGIFYDTFSVLVRAVEPTDGVVIKATPALERAATANLPVFEGVLLYGSGAGEEKVPEDQLRFDEDAQFQLVITPNGNDSISVPGGNLTVNEDESGTFSTNVTTNVAGTITYSIETNGSDGNAEIDTNGLITYTPDDDAFGSDTIVYRASVPTANGPLTQTGTINVTITPVNDQPAAANDNGGTATVGQDPLEINVLANDNAGGGGNEPISELTISVTNVGTGAPSSGSVEVINTTGGPRVQYTPNAGAATGTDTFTYTITDTGGLSDTAVVTVNVVNNSTGVVADDFRTAAIFEDSDPVVVVDLDAQGLLNNASGDDNFVIDSATSPQGTVTFNNTTLEITFEPNDNFFGDALITYTVSNSEPDGAGTGVITVPVTAVNDAPVANDFDFLINERAVNAGINVLQLADGQAPTDVDDAVSTLTIRLPGATAANPTVILGNNLGTAQVDSNNVIRVTLTNALPADNIGISYEVVDSSGAFDNGTISLDIRNVQDPPTADNENVFGTEDENVSVDLGALTTVENNVPLSFTVVSFDDDDLAAEPTVDANNNLIIVPADNFNGTTVVRYRASVTGGTEFAEGNITVTFAAENDAPTIPATFPQQVVLEDSSVDIDVLALANDVDGDTLSAAVASNPSDGTVTDLGAGVFRYTPDANFNGSDSFTVTVSDGNGGEATTLINVSVSDTVSEPVANNSTLSATEDAGSVTLNLNSLVDVDPGDAATITLTTNASNGSASITNGVLTYTPNLNFNGNDSIVYTATSVTDPTLSNTGTISITVGATNDNPIAINDTATTSRGIAIDINVLANDTPDPAGENQTVTVSVEPGDGPANGSVLVSANNVITYTPNAGFADGVDSFTYTLTDSEGGSDTAIVTVTVNDFATRTVSGQLFQDTATNIIDVIQNGATPIGNGMKDDGEMGFGGVAVSLQSEAAANASGGIINLTAITDRNGNYSFEEVPVGTAYTLSYELPPGIVLFGSNARSVTFAVNEDTTAAGGAVLNENLGVASLGALATGGYNVISTSPGLQGVPEGIENDELSSFLFNQNAGLGLVQSASVIGAGFEDALYVELALNSDANQALLTVIDANAGVRTAVVDSSQLQLRVAEDGSSARAQVFGSADDFVFVDDIGDLVDDFPGYQSAIDQILSRL